MYEPNRSSHSLILFAIWRGCDILQVYYIRNTTNLGWAVLSSPFNRYSSIKIGEPITTNGIIHRLLFKTIDESVIHRSCSLKQEGTTAVVICHRICHVICNRRHRRSIWWAALLAILFKFGSPSERTSRLRVESIFCNFKTTDLDTLTLRFADKSNIK